MSVLCEGIARPIVRIAAGTARPGGSRPVSLCQTSHVPGLPHRSNGLHACQLLTAEPVGSYRNLPRTLASNFARGNGTGAERGLHQISGTGSMAGLSLH